MDVIFIYIDACKKCQIMRKYINKAIKKTSKKIKVLSVNSESNEAIDLAIEYGIEDVPACIIGKYVFCGDRGFSYKEILNAIKKTNEGEKNASKNKRD